MDVDRPANPSPPLVAENLLVDRLLPRAAPPSQTELQAAIARTRNWLLAEQRPTGEWCGELEGDSILQSEYILLLAWLGKERSPAALKCARQLLKQQGEDGGWRQYPGAPFDLHASVKAYFSLKLTGHDPESEPMRKAREVIRANGGADGVNSFTRFYLALLGQISFDHCPAVPPEAMLVPTWFPLNIYRISAWSRTIFVPLSVVWAHRPVREIAPELGIADIMLKPPAEWPPLRCPGHEEAGFFSWQRMFRWLDSSMKLLEWCRITPFRGWALNVAKDWILARMHDSDGLGAIFPPIIWSVIALRCLGFAEESPEVQVCLGELDALMLDDEAGEATRLQPCQSPVWDTALALRALDAAGVAPSNAAMQRGVQWLLSRECTTRGDWAETVSVPPGGWYFEYRNAFYPDVDDTAMVLLALRPQLDADPEYGVLHERAADLAGALRRTADLTQIASAVERGRSWMRAMQNRDGGWGAFDRDNDCELLCHVPFADHNAMIDPSSPDLAARVLESLAAWGAQVGEPAVDRAIAYLRQTQEADGAWFGRWGVNYIYGTWQTLVGLRAVGVAGDDPAVTRGVEWLVNHQQTSGGWGETANSYLDPTLRGQGAATPSQTAWALLGLLAAGQADHSAVARGVRWLLDQQRGDGTWEEAEFTGTGFPRVFYLKYHYYRIYFPLLALARYAVDSGV